MASRKKSKGPVPDRAAEDSVRVSAHVTASPNKIYAAWMDERRHSAITGRRATIEQWVGGRVVAADGSVYATHTYLETGKKIVLRWRTIEYADDAVSSTVIIDLLPAAGGTKVMVDAAHVPPELEAAVKKIWRSMYLDPMKRFFSSKAAARKAIQDARKKRVLPRPTLQPRRIPRVERQVVAPEPDPVIEEPPKKVSAKKAAKKKSVKKAAPKKAAPKKAAPKKAAPKKAAPKKAAPKKAAPKKAAPKKAAPKKAAPKKAAPKKAAPKKAAPKKAAPKKAAPKKAAKKAPPKKAAKKAAPKKAAPKKAAPKKAAKKAPPKKAAPKKAAKKAAPKKAAKKKSAKKRR